MLRIIIRSVNAAAMSHVGGPLETEHRTIDIDAPEVEAYLMEPSRMNDHYTTREIIGYELLAPSSSGETEP